MYITSLLGYSLYEAITRLERELSSLAKEKAEERAKEEIRYSDAFGEDASEFIYFTPIHQLGVVGVKYKGKEVKLGGKNLHIACLSIDWQIADLLTALYIIERRCCKEG